MITSSANPTIKQIRKLTDRKERRKTGLFYIEGLRIVAEAVDLSANLDTILYAPELLNSEFGLDLVKKTIASGMNTVEVSSSVFKSFAAKENPQGIAAIVHQNLENLDKITVQADDLWIALDSVQDPGNLGTILRTSDAVGGRGIILLDDSTDFYDPSAVRASMGAVFSQRLICASLAEFSQWAQTEKIPVIGTSGSSQLDYKQYHYPQSMILLMGSEKQGLKPDSLALCRQVVKIPMVGRSDSLNLAVATAVVLYEIFNQRRQKWISSEQVNQGDN